MIKVEFPEPTDAEWVAWRAKCDKKTAKVIEAFAAMALVPPTEDVPTDGTKKRKKGYDFGDLYSKTKEHLLDAFHDKCAFCETATDRMQGDVEHYRPKGLVTDKNLKVYKEHPGYYWLAYDWRNLLPACQICNQPSSRRGKKIGKRNIFEVETPPHGLRPGKEVGEVPLLLHPCNDDPGAHFAFEPKRDLEVESGLLIPLSKRAVFTEQVFGLNLDGISKRRLKTYHAMYNALETLKVPLPGACAEKRLREVTAQMSEHQAGHAEFAIAGRAAVRDWTAANPGYLDPL